jgi:hypothetical protein
MDSSYPASITNKLFNLKRRINLLNPNTILALFAVIEPMTIRIIAGIIFVICVFIIVARRKKMAARRRRTV